MDEGCYGFMDFLPAGAAGELRRHGLDGLEEIRIRVNRPVQMICARGERLLGSSVNERECGLITEGICEHSVYAWEDELRGCFITLPGGHRVGLCGRAGTENGRVKRLLNITGFNFRIAHEHIGCADPLMGSLTDECGIPVSTLILSPPGVGKTTLLRDIARQFSYGSQILSPRKVCIADERSELSGAKSGVPALDVGPRTDVMDGCPKTEAMTLMLRAMSPEILMTDEIGGEGDAAAVRSAALSGVAVMASAHAGSFEEAYCRAQLCELMRGGYFGRVVLLHRSENKLYFEVREGRGA